MKNYLFPIICLSVLTSFSIVSADENATKDASTFAISEKTIQLESCKKSAELRKESIMNPALKDYVARSTDIINKSKNDLDKIKWYMQSSYNVSSSRIFKAQQTALNNLNNRLRVTRNGALATYKAEVSLCELSYQGGEKSKSSSKEKTLN